MDAITIGVAVISASNLTELQSIRNTK